MTKTHSRPHVSDDNTYSESQFKTMKDRPGFPERFGSLQDAQGHCRAFFGWYNEEHYHTGIGLHTPASVHYGGAGERIERRAEVLLRAAARHPERFVGQQPTPPAIPTAVWVNPPNSLRISRRTGLPTCGNLSNAVSHFR